MDVPILDDVTFAQLVEDAKKRIPQYNTGWTDYNLHDPGITFIDLFAWLSEGLSFFADQVTDKDFCKFLKLLGSAVQKDENLNDAIFASQKDLKVPYKAVTLEDYEYLALGTPDVNIARAEAFWNINKVEVIVGVKSAVVDTLVKASEDVKLRVCLHLDKARLLTTLVEVIDPVFVRVNVQADIRTKPLASSVTVTNQIVATLESFLNPLIGGWDGKGWPFGRSVYKSEIIALIESVDGVDCVENVMLSGEEDGLGDYSLVNGNIILSKHALTDCGTYKISIIGSQVLCRRYTL